ncbi:kunitz-type protease inhibitor 1-like [Brienomyrus brachyistius]|uniref:kunitz-type protease inhibitor 1-like n=1 Tax=Brienomyrus brachyistius TaxID=42636 RepID=UPI0020B2AEF7|nr:kunitz-type protease inhibitor 1-like [Brienomyrus brachyistius]
MTQCFSGLLLCFALILIQRFSECVDEHCLDKFKKGKKDFFVDVTDSVKNGATFIDSPSVEHAEDCAQACCKYGTCNLAMLEQNVEGDAVKSCYLFDCLYANRHVCTFVKRTGFNSYILKSVFDNYLDGHPKTPRKDDRPPVADAGEDMIVQPTTDVFLNGFQSRDDHKIVSYKWTLLSGNETVTLEKTQLVDQMKLSNLHPGEYVFQLTVTDSKDQSDSAEVTVRVLSHKETARYCLVPNKVGPCRAYFPRWYYNISSQMCESFVYGGCKGNLNNYLTQSECNNTCTGVSEVSTPASRGFHPPETKAPVCGQPCGAQCFPCTDGCCVDAELECDGLSQCHDGSDEASCQHLNTTLNHLLNIPVDKLEVRCTVPPETGPCRAYMTRFFYNPIHRKCFEFIYGGCGNFPNNFDVESTCLDTCKSITEEDVFLRGIFERSKEEKSHSVGVVIGLLLGGIMAVLLAVLVYRALKTKKEEVHHQRVPVDPTPVPVPDDAEHLVYNTTTKPL